MTTDSSNLTGAAPGVDPSSLGGSGMGGPPGPAPLVITSVLVETLHPHPGNPRSGDVAAIAESLSINGQYKPIVVQKGTGVICAGNHTWMAARSLGWQFIDAVMLDVDDRQAQRILLADNRLADLAHYDNAQLLTVLQSLDQDLAGTGYTNVSVDDLARMLAPPPPISSLVDASEEPNPSDFYPVVKVALAPPDFDRWRQWRAQYGDADALAFVALLDLASID